MSGDKGSEKKGWDKGFACGLGYAIAQMERADNQNDAEYLLRESGLNLKDFSVCDEYDLKEIKKVWGRL